MFDTLPYPKQNTIEFFLPADPKTQYSTIAALMASGQQESLDKAYAMSQAQMRELKPGLYMAQMKGPNLIFIPQPQLSYLSR